MSPDGQPALSQWHAYCEFCEEVRAYCGEYELVVQNDNGIWIHTLLKCPVCTSPVLVVQEPFPDGDVSEPVQLYPTARGDTVHGTPRSVQRAFVEAVRCFERGAAHTATAIMCRRTLEVVAAEHGTTGRDLKARIEALKDQGVIDAALFDWATELRMLGNEAAHGVGQISREDAKAALEFTEAMLSYVYTYRQNFNLFKSRRASAKGKPVRRVTEKS